MTSEWRPCEASNAQPSYLSTSEKDKLLGEIANDFFDRLARGETPLIDEYMDRNPEVAALIRQTFAAVSVIEQSVSGSSRKINGDSVSDGVSIGDFRILRELGRGGMGVVYEAEQLSIGGRRVALKVLPFAAMADPKQLQRFRNEVRAAASLDHPNIVSVYSVGEDRGVHFYAMRLIRGRSMARLIQELDRARNLSPLSAASVKQALTSPSIPTSSSGITDPTQVVKPVASFQANTNVREEPSDIIGQLQALISTKGNARRSDYYEAIADLIIQAAEALEHAHERGVIHRDIKPANVMIDAHSRLYITDFGLAHIDEGVGMTMHSSFSPRFQVLHGPLMDCG